MSTGGNWLPDVPQIKHRVNRRASHSGHVGHSSNTVASDAVASDAVAESSSAGPSVVGCEGVEAIFRSNRTASCLANVACC